MSEKLREIVRSAMERGDWPLLDQLAHRIFFGGSPPLACAGVCYEADPQDKTGQRGRFASGKNVVAVLAPREINHYGSLRCSLCGAYGQRHALTYPHSAPVPQYCLDMGAAFRLRCRLAELGWDSDEEIATQADGLPAYHFMFRAAGAALARLIKEDPPRAIQNYGLNGRLRAAALIITKSALTLYAAELWQAELPTSTVEE